MTYFAKQFKMRENIDKIALNKIEILFHDQILNIYMYVYTLHFEKLMCT